MDSWCNPCKNEFPILNRLNAENKNLRVIGIAIMDVYSESLNFIKTNNVQYKNYWDLRCIIGYFFHYYPNAYGKKILFKKN